MTNIKIITADTTLICPAHKALFESERKIWYDTPIKLERYRIAYITLIPRFLCQNWQPAAAPAIVPSIYGLISIIFFTDWEAADNQRQWQRKIGKLITVQLTGTWMLHCQDKYFSPIFGYWNAKMKLEFTTYIYILPC